jgi:hypothetical protein
MPGRFRIPKAAQEGLIALTRLSEPQMSSLRRALAKSQPSLDLTQLFKRTALEVGVSEEQVGKILTVLASLYSVKVERELGFEEFGRLLFDALKETNNEALELPPERASKLRAHLEELLSLDSTLGVSARAASIMTEHEHVWQSGRILTDLRPIFSQNPAELPTALLVVHNLRIAYKEGAQTREFVVALDSDDLLSLKHLVERALQKESTVRSLAKTTGITCLTVEPE